MIGRIRGIILEKQPHQVMLESNGVGYEVNMPMNGFYALQEIGKEAILYTHLMVREEAQLFGFIHKQERVLFRKLIKVNSVGPKLALEILSSMSAQQFVSAVEHQEINALMQLPGVGKKTAERLVVEMKDRLKYMYCDILSLEPMVDANKNLEKDAVAALVSLGYKHKEASRMVSKVARTCADWKTAEALISDALRA